MTTPSRLVIASCDTVTRVQLDGAEVTLRLHAAVPPDPEILRGIGTTSRLYVSLENMRGEFDATVLRIHIGETYLGSIALYGLRIASAPRPDGTSAGLTSHLDITAHAGPIIAELLSPGAAVKLSLRPHQTLPQDVEISIDRIRLDVESTSDALRPR